MLVNLDWGPWQAAANVLLISGTAYVAIHGLHHEYKTHDSKLTSSGRRISIIIVVMGILTFANGLFGNWISADKERKSNAEQYTRFQTQMSTLSTVTQSLKNLQIDMTSAVSAQNDLIARSNQNISISTALEKQTRVDTDMVLRRLFAESNRVSADHIAVATKLTCAPSSEKYYHTPSAQSVYISIYRPGKSAIRLVSSEETPLSDTQIFHGFFGDIEDLENYNAWSRVKIEITANAGFGPEPFSIPLDEAIDEFNNPSAPRQPAECPMSAMLILNGHIVLSADGALKRRANDRFFEYTALFPAREIQRSRLPTYSANASPF